MTFLSPAVGRTEILSYFKVFLILALIFSSTSGQIPLNFKQVPSALIQTRLELKSIRFDYLDPTYFDLKGSSNRVKNLNETAQTVEGQWVLQKDIPLTVMASWIFRSDGRAPIRNTPMNLCSEMMAPMNALRLFYDNIGFKKCPVKKGTYSWSHRLLPTGLVPKSLSYTNLTTTTYGWHLSKRCLLRLVAESKFTPVS